jgi:hypothetical protein
MPAVEGSKNGKGGDMMAKKTNCGCGCVPPGKTVKRKVKAEKGKASKQRK